MITLQSFDDVLERLGGYAGLREITGAETTAISNWRARGERFPAVYFNTIDRALRLRRCKPARDLFTFQEVPKRKR